MYHHHHHHKGYLRPVKIYEFYRFRFQNHGRNGKKYREILKTIGIFQIALGPWTGKILPYDALLKVDQTITFTA